MMTNENCLDCEGPSASFPPGRNRVGGASLAASPSDPKGGRIPSTGSPSRNRNMPFASA